MPNTLSQVLTKVPKLKNTLSGLSTDVQRLCVLIQNAVHSGRKEILKIEQFEENSLVLQRLEGELSDLKFTLDSLESLLPQQEALDLLQNEQPHECLKHMLRS